MRKLTWLTLAFGAGALIAGDALAGYNSSRSNRGKRPSCNNCVPVVPFDVSLARQPTGYRREKVAENGAVIFRKVPQGRYALAVRAQDARGASLDMIENDVGDIACDWTDELSSVVCTLIVDATERPDVTVRLYSFGDEEQSAAGISETETETEGEDSPAAITEEETLTSGQDKPRE